MKTGMQFTKPQPAARACSAYHSVARWLPTGRKFTTMSVCVSRSMRGHVGSAGGRLDHDAGQVGAQPVPRGAAVDGPPQAGDVRELDRLVRGARIASATS